MLKQYWIIVDLLDLLETSRFDQTMRFRLQFLLYRLKLLLLKIDNCDSEEMAIICPLERMEQLRPLFREAITYDGAIAVQDDLEKELTMIVRHLEQKECEGLGQPYVNVDDFRVMRGMNDLSHKAPKVAS